MESSLVGSATAASLCATAAATRRSAGSRGGARFLSCSCSSRDDPAARGWPVSTSSVGRRLRSVAPGRSLGGSSPQLAGVNGWNGNGSDRRWMALGDSFVLEAREDEYGGMLVDADRLPPDTAAFARSLALSLAYWKSARKKGVWLKLPLDRSEYVPLAVKEGFKYHHAEESYVMLTYWIPDEPCMLPANASHQVGVGGFVINDQMEVLVVQEKYTASTLLGAWKLPTGFILASEEIYTGAVREVKEETGIDTEFVELISFRHAHNVAFQKSDLFFICMLRPLSDGIMVDDVEIQAAKWMPLAEFVEQPFIQEDDMFRKITDIFVQRLHRRYCGLAASRVTSRFDGGTSTLYFNVADQPGDVGCDAA
ncbi:hypothetical protein ABZP36_031729 [Zizania latifolia]